MIHNAAKKIDLWPENTPIKPLSVRLRNIVPVIRITGNIIGAKDIRTLLPLIIVIVCQS
jgi:hypothetical protein